MNHDFVADFETTVYAGQTDTEVWAGAICPVGCDDPSEVTITHSIDEFMKLFSKKPYSNYRKIRVFFHNEKFDGAFILNWLLQYKTQAIDSSDKFYPTRNMFSGTFKYLVSERGVFYSITYKTRNTTIEFLDSYKLLPLSVYDIGNSFATKHRKLTMEYEGYRYAGCEITKEEESYIKNDVLVMSEALQIFFNEGHNKMTIGSNCMEEFKKLVGTKDDFDKLFPRLEEIELLDSNVDEYVRKSYKGGWCYLLRKGKHKNGVTLDINSEYPFVMSKFKIPFGEPKYHKGSDQVKISDNRYVFVRVRCNFELKENMLPTIQIKNNLLYPSNEWLSSSYIYKDGKKHTSYKIKDTVYDTRQELTLCETDWVLLQEHYNLYNLELVDWLEFQAQVGMFDSYMKKYFEIKMNSQGGKRTIAKLFLNNLYGKLGTNNNSSYKIARLEDGVLKWRTVTERNKKTYHVASASAITGWARWYTITHAQQNYDHFVYSDTDSIHLNCDLDKAIGFDIHPTKIGSWDCEAKWEEGFFVRQKTYIEVSNGNPNVVACGMGKKCKKNIQYAYRWTKGENIVIPKDVSLGFCVNGFRLEDFKKGLCVDGNLKGRQIKGGVLLHEEPFIMR